MTPELHTARLTVRLAQPGMQGAMARFLAENFPDHLDRWSPPVVAEYFTESFWAERLEIAVDDLAPDRAARVVIQPRGAATDGPIIGTPAIWATRSGGPSRARG